MSKRVKFGRFAIAGLVALGAAAAAANVVVIRSSGPSQKSYPAGRSLPDNARIALRQGDMVVVLDARGTRTFRGPGTFSPGQAVQAGTRTVATPSGRLARVGAVRGVPPTASTIATTIWNVDVAQGGTVCLSRPSEVTLTRADVAAAADLVITGPNGARRTLLWPAGAATIAWPADMPITGSSEYRLRLGANATETRVRFRTVSPAPSDTPNLAQALIRNGCTAQLDRLLASVPVL